MLAGTALALMIVWMAAKMTRTDQADFRLTLIAVTIIVALVVLLLSWRLGRSRD